MGLTPFAALWFLPFVVPVCLWVAWSDLRTMLIPNRAVLVLVAIFALVGLYVFPTWNEYLWRWSHLGIVLVIGIGLNAAGLVGAGDAKFMAASAPFIALGDLFFLLILFIACLIAGYALHRIARNSRLRALAPDWKSWDSGRRFPMGFPLAATLVAYLVVAALSTPVV